MCRHVHHKFKVSESLRLNVADFPRWCWDSGCEQGGNCHMSGDKENGGGEEDALDAI